jgi:transcriptional regulator GlxA family with amidase domain
MSEAKREPQPLQEITDRRISRVIVLMKPGGDGGMEDFNRLADEVNLSASRLRHLFKAQIGVSFKQYRRELRMERAAHLLENSFLMVKEISAVVGAGDVSHFVKDFEKQYGMSPARYRKQFSDEK